MTSLLKIEEFLNWGGVYRKTLGDPRISDKKSEFISKGCHYKKYLITDVTRNDSVDRWSALNVYEFYNKFSILL